MMKLVSNIWEKFSNIIVKKTADLVGIDIGTTGIKLVEIAWEKGQPVVKKIGIKELPPETVEDGRIINSQQLMETLNQLLAATSTDTKNTVVAVGGRIMFARELIFPDMTLQELREAIKWDIGNYIPYAPGSYYYDFAIIGKGNTHTEIKVLLVASPVENIKMIINIIKKAGLKLIAIDIEPLALQRTFSDTKQTMVIDIGALLSQVIVFQKVSPSLIRNIPIGGKHFTQLIMKTLNVTLHEAEEIKKSEWLLLQEDIKTQYIVIQQQLGLLSDEFAKEIRRTIEYYQLQHPGVFLTKILITGGGAKLNNLVQYLQLKLEIAVVMDNPLVNLQIADTLDKGYLQEIAPQLAIAIGLALRGVKYDQN